LLTDFCQLRIVRSDARGVCLGQSGELCDSLVELFGPVGKSPGGIVDVLRVNFLGLGLVNKPPGIATNFLAGGLL